MKKSILPLLCLATFTLSAKAQYSDNGLDKSGMDPAVRVQDDVYLNMNGKWLERTEIPADRSNYGAFTALDDLSNERIRKIIETCSTQAQAAGSDAQKIGDLYKSFMDEQHIEQLGFAPLAPELAKIRALNSLEEVATQFGYLQTIGVQAPVGFYVGQDDKNSTRYLAHLYQSGLSMPDRDYYLKDDAKFTEARKAYVAYVTQMLTLAGDEPAQAATAAAELLAFETRIAKLQRSKVELRNPERNYNKTPVSVLEAFCPKFAWKNYLASIGASSTTEINIGQPEFVAGVSELLASTPVSTVREYMTFKLMDAYAVALPRSAQQAAFDFHGKTLAGIPQEKPRWKKAVALISGEGAGDFGVLGDALGHVYVDTYFAASSKERMVTLVKNLLTAYEQSIDELSWMTAETKVRAKEKLAKYMTKIAYPDKWRDYSALQVRSDDLMGNLLTSSKLEFGRNLSKLGKPLDRSEWGMTPQTVNAYYNPGLNEIVFPAAILQPPFFNPDADDAVNYGGIGAVIGHEISHGFDDQGSQFDGDGNLRNWWSEADRTAFKALTTKLVAQYSGYEALPGKFVNGELTLGENIADLSGVAIAYKAYLLSLHGKEPAVIGGLDGKQRFFMGWSQVWRRKYRDAELVKRLLTDPHSPSQFRANGPLMNSDAFMDAFGVKPGDKLYKAPADRIRIW